MIKSSVEQIANIIGFEIGMSDNKVQADLLNGFCKGLANSMDKHQLERQICYVVDGLDEKTKEVLKSFNDFIELSKK